MKGFPGFFRGSFGLGLLSVAGGSGRPSGPCNCLPDPEAFSSLVKGKKGFEEVLLEGLKGAPGAQRC